MKASTLPFFGVFLAQQGQRTDALHDVIFLPVLWRGVTSGRTCYRGNGALPASGQTVEPPRKQFRQMRVFADSNQSFGETVKFIVPKWAALLRGHRGFVAYDRR